MAEYSTTTRTLQVGSIFLSSWLSGLIGSATFWTTPVLHLAPASASTKQWRRFFVRGASSAPPLAIATSIVTSTLARRFYNAHNSFASQSRGFWLYTATSILLPSIIPWTLIVMEPQANAELTRLSQDEKAAEAKSDELEGLYAYWGQLNLVRSAMAAVGAGLAGWALVDSILI